MAKSDNLNITMNALSEEAIFLFYEKQLRRKTQQMKNRELCFICNQNKLITELHHVLPVSKMKKILESALKISDFHTFYNSQIWLCPNCHAYLHKLMGQGFENCNYWFAKNNEKLKSIVEIALYTLNYLENQIWENILESDQVTQSKTLFWLNKLKITFQTISRKLEIFDNIWFARLKPEKRRNANDDQLLL